jgi:hypothetical protein
MPNLGRITEPLKALVEALVGRRLDYHALYPCTVAAQSGNTLELIPDDERVRGFGLGSVPIKTGAPGYQYTVPANSRVLLGFEAADPKRPYCALWDSATGVTTLTFDGGSEDIARTDDSVGELYVDNVTAAPSVIVYYRAGTIGTAWVPVVVGGVPTPLTLGTPMSIVTGNAKLKA